jgi:hypothetical protein
MILAWIELRKSKRDPVFSENGRIARSLDDSKGSRSNVATMGLQRWLWVERTLHRKNLCTGRVDSSKHPHNHWGGSPAQVRAAVPLPSQQQDQPTRLWNKTLSHTTKTNTTWSHQAKNVAHLSIRDARNTKGTRGTPEWHPGLVAPVVRRPKWY